MLAAPRGAASLPACLQQLASSAAAAAATRRSCPVGPTSAHPPAHLAPSSPGTLTDHDLAIVGGTGRFLGATGQAALLNTTRSTYAFWVSRG